MIKTGFSGGEYENIVVRNYWDHVYEKAWNGRNVSRFCWGVFHFEVDLKEVRDD